MICLLSWATPFRKKQHATGCQRSLCTFQSTLPPILTRCIHPCSGLHLTFRSTFRKNRHTNMAATICKYVLSTRAPSLANKRTPTRTFASAALLPELARRDCKDTYLLFPIPHIVGSCRAALADSTEKRDL